MDNAKGSGLQQYNEITQQIIEKVNVRIRYFRRGNLWRK